MCRIRQNANRAARIAGSGWGTRPGPSDSCTDSDRYRELCRRGLLQKGRGTRLANGAKISPISKLMCSAVWSCSMRRLLRSISLAHVGAAHLYSLFVPKSSVSGILNSRIILDQSYDVLPSCRARTIRVGHSSPIPMRPLTSSSFGETTGTMGSGTGVNSTGGAGSVQLAAILHFLTLGAK
jgi:hypothetical protein